MVPGSKRKILVATWGMPLLVAALLPGRADAWESYYVVVFAFQDELNLPRYAHSFATFLKATGDGPSTDRCAIEAHTISWYPASLEVRVARLQTERGVNLSLTDTLRLAGTLGARVSHWGPFQIRRELYDRAVAQVARLQSGCVQYKVLDADVRPSWATNCIHAISDLDTAGGLLVTGTARGDQASHLVVQHLRRWMVNLHLSHEWVYHRLFGTCTVVCRPFRTAG
jgi:hypothetical protein